MGSGLRGRRDEITRELVLKKKKGKKKEEEEILVTRTLFIPKRYTSIGVNRG